MGVAQAQRRLTAVVVVGLVLGPAQPARAQTDSESRLGGLSVRLGPSVRFDLHFKTQFDWRDFPDSDTAADVFDLHRARAAIQGTVLDCVEFQLERELRETDDPWRDVYLDIDLHRTLRVRGGQFKIPFSLDQLTGGTDLDFTYRSLAATYLAPGRDLGVMAHGTLLGRRVKYQAGLFRQGGENVRASERRDPQAGRTMAGRLTVRPFPASKAPGALRGVVAGVSITSGDVPAGPNNLRGRTISGDALFPAFNVQGRRSRRGVDVEWRAGPVSLRSEVIQSVDERRGQGTDDDDLSPLTAQGWYLSGTWLVTGERKTDEIRPAHPLFQGGYGALELAARVEHFRLKNLEQTIERPSSSPRARMVLERGDRVWTFGVNWYVNRFVVLQANAICETQAGGGAALPGQEGMWSRVLRVQVEL